MSTLSSANVTDVNLILKERTHKIKMKYSMDQYSNSYAYFRQLAHSTDRLVMAIFATPLEYVISFFVVDLCVAPSVVNSVLFRRIVAILFTYFFNLRSKYKQFCLLKCNIIGELPKLWW